MPQPSDPRHRVPREAGRGDPGQPHTAPAQRPLVAVVMGVSGSGKTTVAQALAARLGWPVLEGDEFPPPANVAKMRAGMPLDDADRWPWLEA
ncbi:MAG: gluconokinase, partial [Acetobacteraceae bacterium]|nr:gluconokinase [Acetobacteraceae bacterium]